ncbi:hypothetical protein BDV98DRAFT_180634 [Pterulicium gracile]|uniref:Uncharacterized protein n=1 Tax=Pterulicium gracile TaxID=1884261 RepID=A0A5C3QDZ6_9AGAR|nr:hypothetical protein BDV98DRAFT_180634 [Pterula gracilis]
MRLQDCRILALFALVEALRLTSNLSFLEVVPSYIDDEERIGGNLLAAKLRHLKSTRLCFQSEELVSRDLLFCVQALVLEQLEVSYVNMEDLLLIRTFLASCHPSNEQRTFLIVFSVKNPVMNAQQKAYTEVLVASLYQLPGL